MIDHVLIAKSWVSTNEANQALGVSREALELYSSPEHAADFKAGKSKLPPIIVDQKTRPITYEVASINRWKAAKL